MGKKRHKEKTSSHTSSHASSKHIHESHGKNPALLENMHGLKHHEAKHSAHHGEHETKHHASHLHQMKHHEVKHQEPHVKHGNHELKHEIAKNTAALLGHHQTHHELKHHAEHDKHHSHLTKHQVLQHIKKSLSAKEHTNTKEHHEHTHKKEHAHKKPLSPKESSDKETVKILEKYDLTIDGATVNVEIRKGIFDTYYNLSIPQIDIATSILLKNIRNELVSVTTISMQELVDPSAFLSIKARFMGEATKLLRKKLPQIEKKVEEFLIGKLIQDMLGLGEIEFLINDPSLEEIVVLSSKDKIRVYSKKYGWLETNIKLETEDQVINYSNIIARRVGRQITVLTPLLDAHLITGDRVNAVLYPIDTKGNTITIRKFARDPFTIVDFINNKTCDLDTSALLWLGIEYEMNILISGGTGSGKTSFLNACMPFVPPNQRIISIEDTRELMLPEFLYWTPLVTRSPNPEGKGEVSMLDLLVNSLRMRPDRIILGEMRRQQEAMVLFEAMHTGHSVYATVHADTASETISRLTNPPLSIPANLLKAVHLNVVMFRDRKKGIRRIYQIAEFETDKEGARANILYRWSPEEDKMMKHSESLHFFEEISRHTGMSQTEISDNLEEKKKILAWLIKQNIRSLNDFGKVINIYYKNKEILFNAIRKNDIKTILGK